MHKCVNNNCECWDSEQDNWCNRIGDVEQCEYVVLLPQLTVDKLREQYMENNNLSEDNMDNRFWEGYLKAHQELGFIEEN